MPTNRFGKPDWARFKKYVQVLPNGCWIWTGATRGNGRNVYGAFWLNGTQRAHIVSYVWTYGEPNADLHHTCENSLCVNPDHITPAAAQQHHHRNVIPGLCAQGHEFDGINARGERTCSICLREAARRYREANRDKVNEKRRAVRVRVDYPERPCPICGTIFRPQRSTGRYCPEPDKSDEDAHRKWRDCINLRQNENRRKRLYE